MSTEQKAGNDAWYIDKSLNISIPRDTSDNELLEALKNNRLRIEELKKSYWFNKKLEKLKIDVQSLNDKNINQDTYFREILRIVNAIEAMKNRLAHRGVAYPISSLDIEHPDSASGRLQKIEDEKAEEERKKKEEERKKEECFIASAIYGSHANETNILREYRDTILINNILGRYFIKIYYIVGPRLAKLAKRNLLIQALFKKLINHIVYIIQKN